MNIEPIYSELSFNNKFKKLISEIKIECKTGVAPDDAVKILAVGSSVTLTGEEVTEGQIRYSGRALFSLAYQTADGDVKKAECGTEFTNRTESTDILASCKSHTKLRVKKVQTETETGVVVIVALIGAETELTAQENVKVLSGGQGLVFKKCEKKIIKETPVKKSVYPVEEDFELNYAVADVLLHESQAVITAVQCGVGSIICDGEIILSMCLLQKIENSDILKETKILPFRLEAEADEAMPAMTASADAAVKSVKIDITVDEASGKSTANVNVGVEISGAFYYGGSEELISDAYSPTCETKISKSEYCLSLPITDRTVESSVRTRGVFAEGLEAGARLMCCGLEHAELTSVRAEGKNIAATGVLEATAFLKDIDGKIFSLALEAPFTANIDFDIGDADYELSATVSECNARIVSLESFELDALIKFRVKTTEKSSVSVISSVEEGEEKTLNTSAISVYIPLEGEELWDVSKRLNTCPELITEYNGELAYPLTGNERIIIYRQEKSDIEKSKSKNSG